MQFEECLVEYLSNLITNIIVNLPFWNLTQDISNDPRKSIPS